MVSSVAPIKAKLRYYADANFKRRVLPRPRWRTGCATQTPPSARRLERAGDSVRARHAATASADGLENLVRPTTAAAPSELSETVAYDPELAASAPISHCSMTTTTCRFPSSPAIRPCARPGWLPSTPTTESSYEPLPPQPVHPAGARQAPGRAGRQERRVQVVHRRGGLASWLSPDAADQREAAIAKLDRLSRQAERMERDQNIAIETALSSATPHGQHASSRGAPRRGACPGQGAVRAVRGAVGPPPAAWAQPGARCGGGTPRPNEDG